MLYQRLITISKEIEDIINLYEDNVIIDYKMEDKHSNEIIKYLYKTIGKRSSNIEWEFITVEIQGNNGIYYLFEIDYKFGEINFFTIRKRTFSYLLDSSKYVECIVDNVRYYIEKDLLLSTFSKITVKDFVENYNI